MSQKTQIVHSISGSLGQEMTPGIQPDEWTFTAFAEFPEIAARDLVSALRHRFDVEHISRYFSSPPYRFNGTSFNIDDDISDELVLELHKIRRKDNINRIVLWSSSEHRASEIHSLKIYNIDLIYIMKKEVSAITSVSHYMPLAGRHHNYTLALNLAADLLLKRLKKMFHLVLSELAAPIYDKLYGKQRIATDEMMRFEEKQVKSLHWHNFVEPEIFNSGSRPGFSLDIEAVVKLASCLVFEVIKSPIGLRRKLFEADPLVDAF